MRTRIIGLAVWSAVLAIGLFGVPLAVAVFQYAMQVERSELQRAAVGVAIAVAGDVSGGDPIENLNMPGSVQVGVYDEDGVWLAGGGPGMDRREIAQALVGGVGAGTNGGSHVVAVPVTEYNDVIGAVRATTPLSTVLQAVALVWSAMAALAALVVAAAWLVGRRQARRPARPLEDLVVGWARATSACGPGKAGLPASRSLRGQREP